MNSLRTRLVLAFTLVALAPLALTTMWFARRIRDDVRQEARMRLDAATVALARRFAADAARSRDQLSQLARDATLKRTYLVSHAGRDLDEALKERRVLLDLDYLAILDPDGRVVAAALSRRLPGDPLDWARATRIEVDGAAADVVPGTAAVALGARAAFLYDGRVAGWLCGGLAIDSTVLAGIGATSGLGLAVRRGDRTVCATMPVTDAGGGAGRAGGSRHVERRFSVGAPGDTTIVVSVLASTRAADTAIARLRVATLGIAMAGVLLAFVLAALWSSSLSRPIERLARFSERIARGEWDEPLAARSVGELDTLARALERMRNDLHDYRDRLRAGERHAAWGMMARQVAHEVRNPLTPIAVSIADLKRSYDQKHPDFPRILDQATRTVLDEVNALKRLLQEFSEFGRMPLPQPAACRLGGLLDSVAALYAGDVSTGRLRIASGDAAIAFQADAAQLTQALVNLIQNGLDATAAAGFVRVTGGIRSDRVSIEVADDGPGLDAAQRALLFTPEYTTKAHGSGLGLIIVERIVTGHGGTITVESAPGRGTTFRILLPLHAS